MPRAIIIVYAVLIAVGTYILVDKVVTLGENMRSKVENPVMEIMK